MTDSAEDRAARLLAAARRGTEPSFGDEARVRSRLHARVLAAPLLLSAKTSHALATGSKLSAAKLVLALGLCSGGAVVAGVALHARRLGSSAKMTSAPVASRAQTASRRAEVGVDSVLASPPAPSASASELAPAIAVAPSDFVAPSSPVPASSTAKRASSASSSAASPLSAEDLSAEISGLRRAQHLLHGGDPGAALAALNQLARAVPKGALMEERDATRALALCGLGHASDPSVDTFFARYPGSVHTARVRSACSRASLE